MSHRAGRHTLVAQGADPPILAGAVEAEQQGHARAGETRVRRAGGGNSCGGGESRQVGNGWLLNKYTPRKSGIPDIKYNSGLCFKGLEKKCEHFSD